MLVEKGRDTMVEIYKVTNMVNGKVYIGQTKQGVGKRWSQHCCAKGCPKLSRAIQKHGKKSFTVVRIDTAQSKEEANQKEMLWIERYNSTNSEYGYNLSIGGSFGNFNEETRKRMSESHKGEKNNFYGKHHSAQAREKMACAKKGVYADEKHPRAKKVVCVETGEVFNTIKEAAKKHKLSPQKISSVCAGAYGRRTTGGLHWEYAD